MIVVSNEMFERLIARAQAVGEEIWRRQLFEHPGMFPKAKPEEIEVVRELFVAAMAEDYCERVAHAAHAYVDARMKAVFDGTKCIGFVCPRGRLGVEAFDADQRSFGIFPTQKEAANAVARAVGGVA